MAQIYSNQNLTRGEMTNNLLEYGYVQGWNIAKRWKQSAANWYLERVQKR